MGKIPDLGREMLLFNAIDPFKTKKLFTLVEVVGITLAIESVCAIDSVVVISTVFGLEGITLLAYLVRSLSSSPLRGAKALTHPDSILFKGERLLAFGQLFPRSLSEDVAQLVLLEKSLFHSVSVYNYNRACKFSFRTPYLTQERKSC